MRSLLCLCLLIPAACQPIARPPIHKAARASTPASNPFAAHEALAEANAARAKRGLRPFVKDDGLTIGAMRCAEYRAEHGIKGHVDNGRNFNDFSFLPDGVKADAAGCGALDDSWGWQTCAAWDRQWTRAGAAWARGSNGLRFMQLFVAK